MPKKSKSNKYNNGNYTPFCGTVKVGIVKKSKVAAMLNSTIKPKHQFCNFVPKDSSNKSKSVGR